MVKEKKKKKKRKNMMKKEKKEKHKKKKEKKKKMMMVRGAETANLKCCSEGLCNCYWGSSDWCTTCRHNRRPASSNKTPCVLL